MAETAADKSQSLAEEYYVKDKQTAVVEKPVEVKEVENPEEAASEEPVAEKTVEETTPVAPAVAQESSEVAPPPAEESTEEQSSGNVEENSGNEDAAEETPEIKQLFLFTPPRVHLAPPTSIKTAPTNFRFPTTNQTRHCFTRYVEYHRCVAAKGEGAPECDKFAKYYRSLCPGEWLEGEQIKSPSIMKQDVAQDNINSYPKKSIPPYMNAISGSLGGIMEASCLQPIDVIKTRLQLDRSGNYKGILHCGATISRTEGVRALWKGLTPFATHLTLKYALRMGSNAVLQSAFKDPETGKVSGHGRFLSGFGAGVIEAVIIVTPFEVVKIRLQQQRGLSPELLKYKGPVHCARMIIREEGFRGLWAGVAPTVMRNGTNQSVMFTAKNAFDVLLWKKHEGDGRVLQPWQSMISGFLAGTAGPICTGPFDVVKTRLMAQSREGGGVLKYKGMIHAIRTIYADEGLLTLWKGLLPRLMRIPPGQAIMWGVADQIIGLYERRYLQLPTL